MATFEGFSEADFDLLPCEFCEELFPFELLMEHQSGCRPDLLHYNFADVVVPPSATIAYPKIEVKSAEVAIKKTIADVPLHTPEKKSDLVTNTVEKPIIKEINSTNLVTDKKVKESTTQIKDDVTKTVDSLEMFEDLTLQETGTKLMAYGSNINKDKRVEEEKPTFRTPSFPLNNADQKDTDDACNSLSDSDEGESLEDFWKRAEIKNAFRLRKVKI